MSVNPKIESRVATLGRLLSEATGQSEIERYLSQFDPKKGDRDNCQNIGKLSRPSLETFAVFLGITDPGNKTLFPNRTKLANGIVRRFNQLVPAKCAECDEDYCVGRREKPCIECHQCGRGAHSCESVTSILQQQQTLLDQHLCRSLSHMVWLCSVCFNSAAESLVSGEATPSSTLSRSRHNSLSESLVKDLLQEAAEEAARHSSSDDVERAAQANQSENAGTNVTEVAEVPTDTRETCKAFLEWTCAHGISGEKRVRGKTCSYKHPQVCKKFLKFGTSDKGCPTGDCNMFHPKLCKFVETEKCCHNSACKLYHPYMFNKARRTAIKKQAAKVAAAKMKKANASKPPAETAPPAPSEKKEEGGVTAAPSDSQDFLGLRDLITLLIRRMEAVEQKVSNDPWYPKLGSQRSVHPSQTSWPPPDMGFRFSSQNAWC